MTRRVNLGLLAFLAVAFLTGWAAFAYGTAPSRAALVVHAVTGLGLLVLMPWKSVIARRSLERARPGRSASLLLAFLVLVSLVAGLLHSAGLPWWGPITAMEVHVGAAIAAVPLAVWHLLARRVRPRPVDLSRRHLLRAAGVVAMAGAAYAAGETLVRLTRLPGAERRFTGSYEVGSFRPDGLPVTSWLLDPVPGLDVERWRLRVSWPGGGREWTYAELGSHDDHLRAVLDCTGGFWSEHDWSGVLLGRLLPDPVGALSVRIVSHTGYDRRYPVSELWRVLLAIGVDGSPLPRGNGYPVRVVAPGRRGFEWVKWVTAVELDELPAWWQPPFPLQ
jgi:DMSO/TMAO reductase YedYZ molybdopterin-dependent catalytic subunit